MSVYSIARQEWAESIFKVSTEYAIYAPVEKFKTVDYELVTAENVSEIAYNGQLPVLPLKAFFFPVKENVGQEPVADKRIIIGVRNCDLMALKLLDAVFLDEEFLDIHYQSRRENTILIGNDCYAIKETCHCTVYGLEPYPQENMDITISPVGEVLYLSVATPKGATLLTKLNMTGLREESELPESVQRKRAVIREKLKNQHKELPGLEETKAGLLKTDASFWQEYAQKCVSCGACAMICPTCHCFLLIDRQNFEKVKNWDTCQYPSFEKVAAGEDPLRRLSKRLKNRYECKYIHKPEMFNALACTGCGRCIDACIGKIDKNQIIIAACKKD
ncbi:MAG: 4Fe-4S dicluster domain-containing protein [Candidatus Cloacimonetes bacterium]|nr:4Fe-4S dicluster domain-containing protein [Candidatus Cloacimonadota bacterium]